jgi:hypothetical protein
MSASVTAVKTDISLEILNPTTSALLDAVFRDKTVKHGLKMFRRGERNKLKLRLENSNVEIWCGKRDRWLRAKPEEVVRQLLSGFKRV